MQKVQTKSNVLFENYKQKTRDVLSTRHLQLTADIQRLERKPEIQTNSQLQEKLELARKLGNDFSLAVKTGVFSPQVKEFLLGERDFNQEIVHGINYDLDELCFERQKTPGNPEHDFIELMLKRRLEKHAYLVKALHYSIITRK